RLGRSGRGVGGVSGRGGAGGDDGGEQDPFHGRFSLMVGGPGGPRRRLAHETSTAAPVPDDSALTAAMPVAGARSRAPGRKTPPSSHPPASFFPAPGPPAMTFQDLILTLQPYWARQGCVIVQPLDMEVGAGTFHWATFLRSIGPEPWNAAYVQPSRRPTD